MSGTDDVSVWNAGGTVFDADDSVFGEYEGTPLAVSGESALVVQQRLGKGAMGEVWEALDSRLGRTVAVKLLAPELMEVPGAVARFVAEARATAQLGHPGIVGVHETGIWVDGRPYYTMDVLRGDTLEVAIDRHHAVGGGIDGLRRLVDRLRRAAEAVGYAHVRGVVHRDLKPANILLGTHGEVLVADWGLVRADPTSDEPVQTGLSADATVGWSGTPRYMSPEQVRGEAVGSPSDVFSLGAVLFRVLAGRPAFPGPSRAAVFEAICDHPVVIDEGPEELREVVQRAMSLDPADRFSDATALAAALASWLEGAARREQALAQVARARAMEPVIHGLTERSVLEHAAVEALAATIEPWQTIADKEPLWALEDRVRRLDERVAAHRRERLELAEGALTHEPDLPEALTLLADHWRGMLEQAEARRDRPQATVAERALRRFDRGAHASFLTGRGWITVVSEPPGAEVIARPVVDRARRRVADGDGVFLGCTPLHRHVMEQGDHQLVLTLPGHHPVVLPVSVGRDQHVDAIPPRGTVPQPLRLLPHGTLGPDDCQVAAGWTWAGADHLDFSTEPGHRVWVDGFVMKRHPVTNRDYLMFLDERLRTHPEEQVLGWAPCERSATLGERGSLLYGRTSDGRFELRPDADGDLWELDWPVMHVDWFGACAFAAWMAEKTGQPWRLPTVSEWEKAGRGSDSRLFPWGDHADAAFLWARESQRARPLPAVVGQHPVDRSPYGVEGLAGNMRDWCLDPAGSEGEQRAVRGGCWYFPTKASMLPIPYALEPHRLGDTIGFRIACAMDGFTA